MALSTRSPIFGHIQDIMVIGEVLFRVITYTNIGINHHYHSFVIQKSSENFFWISELVEHQIFQAHRLVNDGNLYITFRSHIYPHTIGVNFDLLINTQVITHSGSTYNLLQDILLWDIPLHLIPGNASNYVLRR